MFKKMLLKAAAYLLRQSLGKKKGSEAVAHAAPVLGAIADAAGKAAVVQIGHAAKSGGDVGKVVDLVRAAQGAGLIK